MLSTYLSELAASWNLVLKPAVSRGGHPSELDEIDGHPALLRPMLPLIGALLGGILALPVWLLLASFKSFFVAGIAGAVIGTMAVELMTSWSGLNALSSYIDFRRRGASQEEALLANPGSMNEPRPGASMIMMMTIYILRMIFFGLLAVYAPFWFIIAFTGGYLVRADMGTLNLPGSFGHAWIAVPHGMEKRHWHVALCIMIPVGIYHLPSVFLAFGVCWLLSWLGKNLCLEAISGINRQAYEVFGYAGEMVLLFLGVLLFVAP